MPNRLPKGWLDSLVGEALSRHDAAAALAQLPPDVRDAGSSTADLAPAARLLVARSLRRRRAEEAEAPEPERAFLDAVKLHVQLLLDLAVLRGEPFDARRERVEVVAFLAAAVGDVPTALELLPYGGDAPSVRGLDRALRAVEAALVSRFFPPGDPLLGLPLHPGHVAVMRRRIARVAMGFLRTGRLEPEAIARHADYAAREALLLAETLAALLAAAAPPDARTVAVRKRQLSRLALPRPLLREARRAVGAPRDPGAIASGAPERVRPFLFEQLLLAVTRAKLAGEGPTRFVETFGAAARLDPVQLAAAQVEAAAQHGDHHVWFEAVEETGGIEWEGLADEWEATADQLVARVSGAVTDNLGAIVTELRETGELGQLLARAAAGATLTADEKRKVRAQLVDLAKAVPALAIFAAPGGMLLLPLLAKLLPFNLLPSAWDRTGAKGAAGRALPPDPPKKGPPAA